jgi:3-deoxy-7-phosphoheptulonate synthase
MHPNPCEAWCDADQALTPLELAALMDSLAAVASAIGRTLDRGEAVRTGKRVAASID